MYFLVIVCIIGSCVAAILLWRQCRPYQLLWDHSLKGSCWKPRGPIIYWTVHGGKLFVLKHLTEDALTDDSFFRIHGFLSCNISLHYYVQTPNQ